MIQEYFTTTFLSNHMHISCECSAWSLKHDCTLAFSQRGVRMSLEVTRHMLRRQLLRHWYLSGDRVRLRGIIGFLVQGRVRIRIRVRVKARVRVYVSFNIRISCRSICRQSICHGTVFGHPIAEFGHPNIHISFVYNAMGWTGIGDPIHPKCIFLDTQFLNPGKRNSVVTYKQSWVFISAALTLVFEWQVQLGSQLLSAVCAIFLLVCTTSNFNSCDWSHHCQYICSHVRSSCEHFLMKKSHCMENPICVDTPHFTGNVIWSRTKNQ